MTERRFATQVRPGRREARGAALTECVYLTIILVPLLFGTAMIGKLIDVRQTTVQASRYVAWESTVDASAEDATDVTTRFFADRSAALATASGADGSVDAEPQPNALWGERLPASAGVLEDTRVTVEVDGIAPVDDHLAEGPAAARSVGGVVRSAGRALANVSRGEWDLEADGFLRRGVTVPIEGNGWLERRLGDCGSEDAYACLTELSVIMTDDWSVGGDAQAKKRVRSLVPAGALTKTANLLSHAGELPVLKELGQLSGALGKVDVKPLPASESASRTLGDYAENEGP